MFKMNMIRITLICILALATSIVAAREYHVSFNGNDKNDGSSMLPFRTISTAARIAQPGDVITVHSGTYREWIAPERGGTSDDKRIIYQAAEGEKVEIKGSEEINNWVQFIKGVWKVTIPKDFFGKYNPYTDIIAGDWFRDRGRNHHTGEVYLNGKSLFESNTLEGVLNPVSFPRTRDQEGSTYTWFCESDDKNTFIYANFHNYNPNNELVEINVRRACFYPAKTGCDYITIRGFHMSQAATQWAPPTAEQIGLIGTNWSKGWIIENNVVSDSKCSGITLGKYGDEFDNTSANSAEGYVKTVEQALKNGWNKETIGHHIVRNNTIFNCEQAGICGSLGAVFSQITKNHIYNIWTKRQFSGSEMGGIKIHASIDMLIKNNCIHNADIGLWMDWMSQGTRITGNICFDNSGYDFLSEVNHGPYLVDNNLLMSETSLYDVSNGGAFVHNLFLGRINRNPDGRNTPYHKPHSTEVVALKNIPGGDNRFYNNIFVAGYSAIPASDDRSPARIRIGYGLDIYNDAELPMHVNGNIYYKGAKPYGKETNYVERSGFDPQIKIDEEQDGFYLYLTLEKSYRSLKEPFISTQLLGKAMIPDLQYVNPDGSSLKIDMDYYGAKRNEKDPSAGPFEKPVIGKQIKLKVW
jgi:hypothetical protein